MTDKQNNEVDAWCVKDSRGMFVKRTLASNAYSAMWAFKCCGRGFDGTKEQWKEWEDEGFSIVKVKITEVQE